MSKPLIDSSAKKKQTKQNAHNVENSYFNNESTFPGKRMSVSPNYSNMSKSPIDEKTLRNSNNIPYFFIKDKMHVPNDSKVKIRKRKTLNAVSHSVGSAWRNKSDLPTSKKINVLKKSVSPHRLVSPSSSITRNAFTSKPTTKLISKNSLFHKNARNPFKVSAKLIKGRPRLATSLNL